MVLLLRHLREEAHQLLLHRLRAHGQHLRSRVSPASTRAWRRVQSLIALLPAVQGSREAPVLIGCQQRRVSCPCYPCCPGRAPAGSCPKHCGRPCVRLAVAPRTSSTACVSPGPSTTTSSLRIVGGGGGERGHRAGRAGCIWAGWAGLWLALAWCYQEEGSMRQGRGWPPGARGRGGGGGGTAPHAPK